MDNEAVLAKRFAEEMGMGSVGKPNGIMAVAARIKRRIVGGKVSPWSSRMVEFISATAGKGGASG